VLPTFEIEPGLPQRGTVIWMHGLGATNHDFDSIVPELDAARLRFVFPAAPQRPVTINGGARMPAWYDILSFENPPLREDESHVQQAALEVQALIDREQERGIEPSKVVIAGFSQGGAMALHVGLRAPDKLAGILVLSGYLLVPQRFEQERSASNAKTPVLTCHGQFDPVVPLSLGKSAHDTLKAAGYPAEFVQYPMQHSLCLEEVYKIRGWLRARLP
jgi:phospholipase/carboxylesterase